MESNNARADAVARAESRAQARPSIENAGARKPDNGIAMLSPQRQDPTEEETDSETPPEDGQSDSDDHTETYNSQLCAEANGKNANIAQLAAANASSCRLVWPMGYSNINARWTERRQKSRNNGYGKNSNERTPTFQ
ncbi:hypothetical protein Plec18167_009244 [Paecilomyces lecythidis]|uniref:Uncharacterized protein n=1 Tax=Paecilomyces lecythidis TaxID=3004212 RepID=A0ABR3WQ66_9EURO